MKRQILSLVMAASILSIGMPALAADDLVWKTGADGKQYWYEGGVKQGTVNDEKGVRGDGTIRGREIYDPASNGWYWLDAVYDGAKATDKEVWIPYIYQDEASLDDAGMRGDANASDHGLEDFVYESMKNHTGKWVRYDADGAMYKGWVSIEGDLASIYPKQAGNIYYYDTKTGLMAKGTVTLDGITYHFDETSGALDKSSGIPVTLFGATPDDGTDDTAAFNEALNALSSYGTSTLTVPNGTYNINGSYATGGGLKQNGIQPLSGQTIQLADGTILKEITRSDANGQYNVIQIRNQNNVTIRGGAIIGNRNEDTPSYTKDGYGEEGFGIDISDSSGVLIENITIKDCLGDGIYIVDRNGSGCEDVHIRNCVITNSCRSNITVRAGRNIEISGCTLSNANINNNAFANHEAQPEAGVNIEPHDGSVSNVTIDGCTFTNNKNSIQVENHTGNAYSRITGIVIKNCNGDRAIYGHHVNNLRVINSTIQGRYYADETKSGEWPWFGTSIGQ